MEKKKVRATRTNGRKDSNGVFKAGHNDRSFNLENAEHVDADRSKWNVYWDYLQGYNLADENGVRPCFLQVLFGKNSSSFWRKFVLQNGECSRQYPRPSDPARALQTFIDFCVTFE